MACWNRIAWGLFFVLASCGRELTDSFDPTQRLLVSGPVVRQSTETRKRPIILVPGWGYRLTGRKVSDSAWGNYIAWLVEDGYERDDIHVIGYPYQKSLG